MKRSLKNRYHVMLAVLFGILIIQLFIVLYTISSADNLYTLASDIQSIMIVFLFGIFVYLVVMFNYVPYRIHMAAKRVKELIDEISNGNYQLDMDSWLLEQDDDFKDLILALKRMLGIILRFDTVKADKIYEHHQRISQLLNLLPQVVMITTVNGDLIYMNDVFRKKLPRITEMSNLNELIIKDQFYAMIFDHIAESLRYGRNIYDYFIHDELSARVAMIKGSIIRNRKGIASGGVFTVEVKGD